MASRTQNQRSQILTDIHQFGINCEKREIYLHSTFSDEDTGIDYRMAASFLKNLHFLDSINNNDITIHLDSTGGNICDTLGIHDAIKNSKSQVTIIGYGTVASGGTIILQAGDKRILCPNTTFLIHYGYDSMDGNHTEVKLTMAQHSKYRDTMVNIYANRCMEAPMFSKYKNKETAVTKYLREKLEKTPEWYLTAKEAVEYGFADSILGE